MNLLEVIIGLIYSIVFITIAFLLRPKFATVNTVKYFIPGLLVKIIGGLCVGMIYYLYYGGGDTVSYYNSGAMPIFDAFLDSPITAFKIIFLENKADADMLEFTSRILFYKDPPSFACIRYAGLFNLFAFNTYSGTVIIFAFTSFLCIWKLFQLIADLYPQLTRELAISFLFLPSVFFWGSGILKDTITFAFLCLLIFSALKIYFHKQNILINIASIIISAYVISSIKIYILIAIIPAIGFLFLYGPIKEIKNQLVRIIITPLVLVIALLGGFYGIEAVTQSSDRYNLETLAYTASETAKWIHYVSLTSGGSAYSLGDYDFSAFGVLKKTIPAIWVSLFRPHPWEIKNPVMLLSGIEALFFLYLFFTVFIQNFRLSRLAMKQNILIPFNLIFALIFSWAVGLTTYNFGSLVRYKIPMMPFFILSMYMARYYVNQYKKS